MTCKVQILAPIVVGNEIKTSGVVMLPDSDAEEHDKAGRVLIVERDGIEEQWAGCCSNRAHEHG
ncbi:MAG TPA: hypothetical protein PLL72_03020 [Burkholderiaceae bacterium]|nr:hypothetical protein [Burkholderiaceae bacterium]